MKNWKKISFIAFALMLCFSGVFGGTMLVNKVSAEEVAPVTTPALEFDAISREETPISAIETGDWSGNRYQGYSWNTIERVNLKMVGQLEVAPNTPYSLNVEYIQRYREQTSSFDAENADDVRPPKASVNNIYTGKINALSELPSMTYYFDCHKDDINIDSPSSKLHKNYGDGWGIYRFSLVIDRTTFTSEFVVVRPVTPTANPVIKTQAVSSQSGIESAYKFTLNEEYKYADAYTIKWYVSGESVDGSKYVLTQDDLALDGVTAGTKVIYNGPIERYGNEFYLDLQNLAGKWDVHCEIYDITRTQVQKTSESVQVTSGNKVKKSVLIWCLIAGGVVLLAIIIFIIVKSVKKEKVW